MENKKTPEIRFPGFTGDWEQRKLGEFVSIKSGWSPSDFIKNDDKNSSLFIKVDDLNYSSREQIESHMKVQDNPRFIKMKKGSTIFPKRGAAIMTNKVRILESDGYMDTNMMALEPESIDGEFLYTFIEGTGLYKIADTSTIPQINNKHIQPYVICLPRIDEQEKISNFFKKLDSTIALQQQELTTLKQTKQGFLQKMFPKEGESVPEVRFPGFSGDWEQRKLNNYLETSKSKNTNELYTKSDVLSVSGDFGIVNQIEFQGRSFAGVSVAPYGIVEKKNIVYTKSPLKSNPYGIIKVNKGKPGIVSTLYAIYKAKSNTNPNFVEYYFADNLRLNKYLKPLVNKGAKNDMKVSDDNALIGDVIFPVDLEEQVRIAEFFKQLDDTIALQEKELQTLKQTKKAFLQKMFV